MKELKIKKLVKEAITPTRAYENDAGADLYSLSEGTIMPGEGYKISTGIAADIPSGYYVHIHTRSSMSKLGWIVTGGVVDCSYKGELFVMLRNTSNLPLTIKKGDRIAQLVIYPIVTPTLVVVDDIGTSNRNSGGFGSTGV